MVGNSNGYRAHEGAMAAPQAAPSTSSVDDEVERLKMEIREVKAMIWDGKLKLSAAQDNDELQFLRDEQRWLFDETRKLRDEVRIRLEARNIQMQQQHQLLTRCLESSPPVNLAPPPAPPPSAATPSNANSCLSSGGFGKMAMVQRPPPENTPWLYPDFVHGWHQHQQQLPHELQQQQQQRDCRTQQHHQQQQQRVRDSEAAAVDWTCFVQPPQQEQQQQQQNQSPGQLINQQHGCPPIKSRLAPLRPRKDSSGVASLAEPKGDALPMQPPKSNNNNKRRRNSGVKEEQESFASGGREERGKRPRWKDHWVMQLIQVRGGMQEEFSKPPKQGVDLWRQVYTKLVASCPDFDKEPEACRKKWKMIVTDYKASNNHSNEVNNSSSNNNTSSERPEKCKWYQMMDEYITIKEIQTSVVDPADNNPGGALSLEEVEELRKDDMPSSHSSDKLM